MKYLMDTHAVIALMKGHPHLMARMKAERPGDFALSAIVAHELYYGAYKSSRQAENLARVAGLAFPVLEFDREDAQAAGAVRAGLAQFGTPIGPYDVLIAGQALSRKLVLITRNLREFERVTDLLCEDWEGAAP
jgi:tRNA(fMet)-specific endonuclease VapC